MSFKEQDHDPEKWWGKNYQNLCDDVRLILSKMEEIESEFGQDKSVPSEKTIDEFFKLSESVLSLTNSKETAIRQLHKERLFTIEMKNASLVDCGNKIEEVRSLVESISVKPMNGPFMKKLVFYKIFFELKMMFRTMFANSASLDHGVAEKLLLFVEKTIFVA